MHEEGTPKHLIDLLGSPWWEEYDKQYHPRRKYFAESVFKYNPDSVLELGCCGGCNIAHFPKGKKIIGIDLNPGAIEYAKKTKPDVTFLNKDITLPFDFLEEPVDIICSMGTLMHIPEDWIDLTLQNMLNFCKIGLVLIETVGILPGPHLLSPGALNWSLSDSVPPGLKRNQVFGAVAYDSLVHQVDSNSPAFNDVKDPYNCHINYDIPKKIRRIDDQRFSIKVTELDGEAQDDGSKASNVHLIEVIKKSEKNT